MHDRARLREALATAIAAAQDARAPDRVLALLRGAYRSLESAHFVDPDMIRWAEAGLGAWRRWSASRANVEHRLLIVDPAGELAPTLQQLAPDLGVVQLEVARSRSATLEMLATQSPSAILFDHDAGELAPSVEMLEWLATDFAHIRRIGFARQTDGHDWMRGRGLYHTLLAKPPAREQLELALAPLPDSPSSRP
jgi:CheY-like chemotaxis protein